MERLRGVLAIILKDGRILVNKRTENCEWEPDVWSIPCGKVEKDENPEEAVVRELKEELGVEVRVVKKVSERTYFLRGRNAEWTVYEFVPPDRLSENFFPELRKVVEDFLQKSTPSFGMKNLPVTLLRDRQNRER